MSTFLIGYDLENGGNYKDLHETIKAYETYWHHLDSTWLIVTDDTAKAVRDNLKQHLKEQH